MMSAVDTGQYANLLEDFLLKMQQNLNRTAVTAAGSVGDLTMLEQYVLDLNTFYYESFHDHFMPLYKQTIENEVRRLLNLNLQDSAVKNNLMTTLKLYIKSFNQTKYTLRQLQEQRQEVELQRSALQTGNDIRSVDLLYILKEQSEAWTLFCIQAETASKLTEDDSLLKILNNYPVCTMAANLIPAWGSKGSKEKRLLNRLLADWQLGLKVLQKLQENPPNGKDTSLTGIEQLEEIDSNWDNRKVNSAVRSWYQSNVQKDYHLYLDVLKSAVSKNEFKRSQRHAGQFRDWLQAWLSTLEQCITWESRGWGQWVQALNRLQYLNPQLCQELADYGRKKLKSLNVLIEGLSSSADASYRNYSEGSRNIISEAYNYLQPISLDWGNFRSDPLSVALFHLISQLDLSLNQIDLIDEREFNSEQAINRFSSLLATMDANIVRLESSLELMAKQIASPGMKGIFQEMHLSFEQITIEKGAILPASCRGWADKGQIESRQDAAAAGTVMYTEGDIFRIRLGEVQYDEVPRIIIAKKG